MHDPLGETREMLGRIERGIDAPLAQRDLFAAGHDAIVAAGEPHVTSREDGADAAIDAPAAHGCDGGEATAVEAAARTAEEIGRGRVLTQVNNAQLVCRLL